MSLVLNMAFGFVFCMLKRLLVGKTGCEPILPSVLLGCVWAACFFLISIKFLREQWGNLNEGERQT